MDNKRFYTSNLLFCLMQSAFYALKELPQQPFSLIAIQFALFSLIGFLITSAYRNNFNSKSFRFDKFTPIAKSVLKALLICSISLVIYDVVLDVYYFKKGFTSEPYYGLIIVGYFIDGIIIFSPWFFLFHLYKYGRYLGEIERVKTLQELELSKAKIQVLLNKLNPHFLYNTLNTIRWLILKNKDRARQAVSNLGEIMRYLTNDNGDIKTSLVQELQIVERYIQIESWRFQDIQYKLDCNEKLLNIQVPRFMLLNLVENAFTHGLSQVETQKEISIDIYSFGSEMFVEVANTGELHFVKKGFGLSSIETLIANSYGGKASVSVRQEKNKVISTVKLPYVA